MRSRPLAFLIILLASSSAAHSALEFAVGSPDARPVSFISSTTAVLNWETVVPCETKIQLRQGTFPAGTPGHEDVWKDAKIVSSPIEKMRRHSMELTDLKPATRYYYRLHNPERQPADEREKELEEAWSAHPPWSREYAFATSAAPGKKAFVRIPVKTLIVANVIDFSTIKPDTPLPEPMSDGEIEMYKRELRQSVLFYWVNSHMMYWIDMEFFIDPQWQRVGDERDDLPEFYKDWPALRGGLRIFDSADISNHQAGWPLKEKKIYTGQVVMRCTRRWDEKKSEWTYQRSGGGTFGANWMAWQDKTQCPAPGRSQFLGGSDICWLMTHEFKHQVESQHKFSGLHSENDRMIFCHYAPEFEPPMGRTWKWCTAYAHGRHFDGIAYELRVMTPVQYMRNVFGHVAMTEDMDGDGVPDDDPRLPLDEKRFGSDPRKTSTDGSGMTDLQKIMLAKWVPAVNTNLRDKLFSAVYAEMWRRAEGQPSPLKSNWTGDYFLPDPRTKDSDGDGIDDVEDPYPIYPWEPVIKQGTMTVDGDLGDWEKIPAVGQLTARGVSVVLRNVYDHEYLYYEIECSGPVTALTLVIDGDADGFTVGNDNLRLIFSAPMPEDDPGEGTNVPRNASLEPNERLILRDAGIHMASHRSWPHWDDGRPFKNRPKEGEEQWEFQRPKIFGDWQDIVYVSKSSEGKKILEVAIPNGTGKMPIQIGPGHTAAISLDVQINSKGTLSIYEPQTLFRTTAQQIDKEN